MARDAVSVGANVFQFFTRNPRGGAAKEIDAADVAEFLRLAAENGLSSFLAHAPYTLNACAAEPRVREFALSVMADDLRRMEAIPGTSIISTPAATWARARRRASRSSRIRWTG